MTKRLLKPIGPFNDVYRYAWSASKISQWLYCGYQQWYNTHRDCIPPDIQATFKDPDYLTVGSLVHTWAEKTIKNESTAEVESHPLFVKTKEYLPQFGKFLKNNIPTLCTKLLGAEYEVYPERYYTLDAKGKPTPPQNDKKFLVGKMDYVGLSKDGKRAIIIDYKTTEKNEFKAEDYQLQMRLYAYMLHAFHGVTEVLPLIYLVKFDTLHRVTLDLSTSDMAMMTYDHADTEAYLKATIKQSLDAALQPKQRIGSHCEYCQFKVICH